MTTLGISGTSPATTWERIDTFPHVFPDNKWPKALFVNTDGGSVTMVDRKGTSMTFFLAAGIPIPLRPKEITSVGGGLTAIIVLYD